jgi:hypothetical protein
LKMMGMRKRFSTGLARLIFLKNYFFNMSS